MMYKDEILSARFTDNAWVEFHSWNAIPHGFPHVLEDFRGPREVDAAQVWTCQGRIANLSPRTRNEVYDAWRYPRFFK